MLKLQERARLKKSAGKLTSGRNSSNGELSADVQHIAKVGDLRVAKADTYKEKVPRRTAEISCLSEALTILSESAFLQQPQTLSRVSVHSIDLMQLRSVTDPPPQHLVKLELSFTDMKYSVSSVQDGKDLAKLL